jgi:hypothetical protein
MTMSPGGVVHHLGPAPPLLPGPIASSIKSAVHDALRLIPPDKNGALVAVATENGVNLAVAHRSGSGNFEVAAWIGKSWGEALSGGAAIRASW